MTDSVGRRVLVTGAGSGIGQAVAATLLQDGAAVTAVTRREAELPALARALPGAAAFACDIADPAAVARLFDGLAAGQDGLDAVVHAAGIYGPIGPFHETDPAEWLGAVTNNLFGFYLVARAAVPLLRRGRLSRILVLAGGGAFTPLPRCSAYASAKAGIVRLVETAAEELAPLGIAVLALAPGFVATGIHRATLEAGPERAGRDYYEFTRDGLRSGGVPMSRVVDCARFLLGPPAFALSGRTISAAFDPWDDPDFLDALPLMQDSQLYRSARINLRDLPAQDPLRQALEPAQARAGAARARARAAEVRRRQEEERHG